MSLRAAILCRKSNQQEATGDEKSIALQERECRALIERNNWQCVEVFTEDVVSGALMTPEGRPELFRLLAACEAKKREFDVVVVSHEDRIGRDTFRSYMVIMRIIESGVRLVSVASGERKLDTPTDELLLAISGFTGSAERHSVSRRVRAKAFDSARRGHTTGSRAFGYDSVEVNGHKELRVNAAQAEIVRWMFDLCQQGYGIRRIAHRLNEQHSGLQSWGATGVRDILKNEIYIGQVVYGRTRNEMRKGVRRKVAMPEAEWVRIAIMDEQNKKPKKGTVGGGRAPGQKNLLPPIGKSVRGTLQSILGFDDRGRGTYWQDQRKGRECPAAAMGNPSRDPAGNRNGIPGLPQVLPRLRHRYPHPDAGGCRGAAFLNFRDHDRDDPVGAGLRPDGTDNDPMGKKTTAMNAAKDEELRMLALEAAKGEQEKVVIDVKAEEGESLESVNLPEPPELFGGRGQ